MRKRICLSMTMGGIGCSVSSLLFISLAFFLTGSVQADLAPENLLVLVNSNSATSRYVAKMYRQYYPAIRDNQVLELSGLPDCSGPTSTAEDEIITRQMYNTCIAEPVREYLVNHDLLEEIMVIVTTAGMPYRIEDTTYTDVVYPAGSNYNRVLQNTAQVDAASVESELTCLWYTDAFGPSNRMVNPYQGYRNSSITLFDRLTPGTKTMVWTQAMTAAGTPPKMEGVLNLSSWPLPFGTIDRQFSAGDMYLTCRLDGPKGQGKSAVFAVRQMLERSKRASSPGCGVDPLVSVAVIDDAPGLCLDGNRVYNLDGSMNYCIYNPDLNQPPDAATVLTLDDYVTAYQCMTNQEAANDNAINTGQMEVAHGLKVVLDSRVGCRTSRNDLGADERVSYFCCYGRNGDEGGACDYLINGAGGGNPLFNLANGAVFTSIESFNALTFFSDLNTAPVAQEKIIDFITIGGSGAIGHVFEPISTAIVDNSYVAYNLFADSDFDGRADLTWVEAAFTGIPFLSWAEVVIGDPLMRIAYGPGEETAWTPFPGDVNGDNRVNIVDIAKVRQANGGVLYASDPVAKDKYYDLADINADGRVNIVDIALVRSLNGTVK